MLALGALVSSHASDLPPGLRKRLNEVNAQWAAGMASKEFLLPVKLKTCWVLANFRFGGNGWSADGKTGVRPAAQVTRVSCGWICS
jgi:hypothetical protein